MWEYKRLLILGMTYPVYSNTYVENVCTGALDEETNGLVRIHPIPRRHMEPGQRFKNFQWIRARVRRHPHDPRPESLRIEPESIEVEAEVPSRAAEERCQLLLNSPHCVDSVTELEESQREDGISLGILQPHEITRVYLRARSQREAEEWAEKEQRLMSQETLPFDRPLMRLDFPDTEFRVCWTCNDGCKGHDMGLKTWGLHELWRRYRNREDGREKVLDAMRKMLNLEERQVFLFLGSIRQRLYQFSLMDSYSAPRQRQVGLFM